eukprot:355919-Pelagomonas_calceolata.AAC.1
MLRTFDEQCTAAYVSRALIPNMPSGLASLQVRGPFLNAHGLLAGAEFFSFFFARAMHHDFLEFCLVKAMLLSNRLDLRAVCKGAGLMHFTGVGLLASLRG